MANEKNKRAGLPQTNKGATEQRLRARFLVEYLNRTTPALDRAKVTEFPLNVFVQTILNQLLNMPVGDSVKMSNGYGDKLKITRQVDADHFEILKSLGYAYVFTNAENDSVISCRTIEDVAENVIEAGSNILTVRIVDEEKAAADLSVVVDVKSLNSSFVVVQHGDAKHLAVLRRNNKLETGSLCGVKCLHSTISRLAWEHPSYQGTWCKLCVAIANSMRNFEG